MAEARTTRDFVAHNPLRFGYRLTALRNWYAGPGFKEVERRFGLGEAETSVLVCVGHMEGLRAKDVGAISGRPKNSISRAVQQLARKRLLVQRADREDGRERTLAATEEGMRLYRAILPIFEGRQADLLSPLDAEERRVLDRLLDGLVGALPGWTREY